MGQIQINTPEGPQILNIAGDEPTPQELEAARQQFFPESTVTETTEEVEVPRGPTNPGEVKSIGFRWRFGKADNVVGKTRVIEETFGEGSAIQFGPEDYGIDLDKVTEDIKTQYNLPNSGTIRVNKPGYSHWDLINFGAEVRGPLVAAMVAAPFTAGMSLPVAAATIGGAALIGKGVDELQEDLQGVQDQQWLPGEGGFFREDSVVKDMLKEGVIMAAGEFILRPVFSFAGRLIKGPGPGYEPDRVVQIMAEAEKKGIKKFTEKDAIKIAREESRAIMNRAIDDGARPTIGDATGKFLADRGLAIMEAIFPNTAAVRQNTTYVRNLVEQFKKGKISETQLKEGIDNRMGEVAKELETLMKDPTKAVNQANKELQKVIAKEVDLVSDVIKKYAETNSKFSVGEAEILLNQLSQVERLWRSRGGDLYKNAAKRLDNVTFPLDSFNNIFRKLDSQVFKESQKPVMGSEPMQKLRGILEKNQQIDDLTIKLSGLKTVGRPSAEKAAQIKSIEAQLKTLGDKKTLSYDELNQLRSNLQSLKSTEAVREISSNTGPLLKEFTDEITNILTRAETEGLKTLTSKGGARRAAGVTNQAIDAEQAGFQMLRDANKYYADGAKIFLKPEIEALKADINAGAIVDMKRVAEVLVKPGEPLYLKQFLKALTFADDVGTSEIRNLSKGVLEDLKSLAEVGDTVGFNSLLKASGIDKKLIRPFEDYAIQAVKQGRTDDSAFVNITSNKAQMIKEMIDINVKPAPVKEGFVENLANQWVQNTLVQTSSKNAFNSVGFFDAFSKLGPELQNTLFKPNTIKALKSLQDDAFLLSDKQALRELNASNINQLTARELVETLQRDVATSEQIGANALTKAIAQGEITSINDLTKGLIKNPSRFQQFKTSWNNLPKTFQSQSGETVVRPTFDQVMNGPQGVKANVIESIMRDAFPDGVNIATLDMAKFGNNITKSIKNNREAFITIFGDGNEALGKGFVKDLENFGKQAMVATTKSYKGKAGLAAATYIAGAYAAFTAGAVAFTAGAAFIYVMPRLMRSRPVLRFLTNPRTNANIYNKAKELGIDVGDKRALSTPLWAGLAQETLPLEVRQTINTLVREFAVQAGAEDFGNTEPRLRQAINQMPTNLSEPNRIRLPNETITETETAFVERAPSDDVIIRRPGQEYLRQIEEEKLVGIRN